jgi:hypothetical protein
MLGKSIPLPHESTLRAHFGKELINFKTSLSDVAGILTMVVLWKKNNNIDETAIIDIALGVDATVAAGDFFSKTKIHLSR